MKETGNSIDFNIYGKLLDHCKYLAQAHNSGGPASLSYLRALVEGIKDPYVRHNTLNFCNAEDMFPLIIMSKFDFPEAVEYLLEHCADVETCDSHGVTSIFPAVIFHKENSLMTLLRHGGDINRQDINGRAPLHYLFLDLMQRMHRASQPIEDQDMKYLIKLFYCGADPTIADRFGDTPLSYIKRSDVKAPCQLVKNLLTLYQLTTGERKAVSQVKSSADEMEW